MKRGLQKMSPKKSAQHSSARTGPTHSESEMRRSRRTNTRPTNRFGTCTTMAHIPCLRKGRWRSTAARQPTHHSLQSCCPTGSYRNRLMSARSMSLSAPKNRHGRRMLRCMSRDSRIANLSMDTTYASCTYHLLRIAGQHTCMYSTTWSPGMRTDNSVPCVRPTDRSDTALRLRDMR